MGPHDEILMQLSDVSLTELKVESVNSIQNVHNVHVSLY